VQLAQIAIGVALPAPAELIATGLARTDEFYQAASLEIGNVAPGGFLGNLKLSGQIGRSRRLPFTESS